MLSKVARPVSETTSPVERRTGDLICPRGHELAIRRVHHPPRSETLWLLRCAARVGDVNLASHNFHHRRMGPLVPSSRTSQGRQNCCKFRGVPHSALWRRFVIIKWRVEAIARVPAVLRVLQTHGLQGSPGETLPVCRSGRKSAPVTRGYSRNEPRVCWWSSAADFLECPRIAVRIREVGVSDAPAHVVDLGDRDPATGECSTRDLDVVYDEVDTLNRCALWIADTYTNNDRARRSGWGELHDAHPIAWLDVVIQNEPDLVDIKRFTAVHIRRRKRNQFQSHIHHVLLTLRRTAPLMLVVKRNRGWWRNATRKSAATCSARSEHGSAVVVSDQLHTRDG